MELNASYHQERLWFIDTFESGNLYEAGPVYHNIPLIFEITGTCTPGLLEKSIRTVIHRHEALRTRIITQDNQAIQSIVTDAAFTLEVLDLVKGNQEVTVSEAYDSAIAFSKKAFKLDEDLLIRGQLIHFHSNGSLLVLSIHHIIADITSLKILGEEIFACYHSYLLDQEPDLPELPAHYADFAQWQHQLTEEELETQIFYWKRKLKGKLQALELPTDVPREQVHIFHEGHRKFIIDETLISKIEKACNEGNTTPSIFTLAAYKILLAKYCRQEEILVGTSDDNREQPGLEQIIGPIANLLVLRSFVSDNDSLDSFLEDLEKTVTEAKQYKDIPFERLDLELKPTKDMSRTVFFDVLFQYRENDGKNISSENLEVKTLETNLGYGKYDLNLLLLQDKNQIEGFLVYNIDYYHQETIQRFITHYLNLLDSMTENLKRPVSSFDILDAGEKEQLLYRYNQVDVEFPSDKTIHQLFEEQVNRTPEHIAVKGEKTLTYSQLNQEAGQLALQLKNNGVMPETIVAVTLPRTHEMIVAIIGILKAGGAYLPIDPDYPEDRIQYTLQDSHAPVQIVLSEGKLQCIQNPQSVLLSSGPTSPVSHPGNLAYIIYTSGTSGRPKGTMIEHRNVVRLMFNQQFQFDFNDGDVWTLFHSYCFDFSVWEMYGALLYGGQLIVIPKMIARDTEAFLETLEKEKVTVLNQTPSAFYNLSDIEKNRTGKNLSIRYIIFGGEALTPSRLKDWHSKYPATKLINMYGITETTVHVTYKEITEDDMNINVSNIGLPIPTLSTYIMDQHQKLLPIGIAGELTVGGYGVGRGYLNRPQLTGEKFIENPYVPNERLYRSGDLAKRLANGDLQYLGRIDHQVKIRGFRIELGEIENQLLTHPQVSQVVVIDDEDNDRGRFLCAYFVSPREPQIQDLKEHIGRKLPDYMIPSYFIQIKEIPLNANGKIDRHALPKPSGNIATGVEYAAPGTEMEKIITQIWIDVLKIENPGINDNFFDLGGTSINILKVNRLLKEKTNIDLPVVRMFEYPTIKELAHFLEEEKTGNAPDENKKLEEFNSLQENSMNVMDQTLQILSGFNTETDS